MTATTISTDPIVHVGPEIAITQSSDVRQIPHAFATDIVEGGETKRKVTVHWNEHNDDPTVPTTTRNSSTVDDGATWSPYGDGTAADLKLSNGNLWYVNFSGYMVAGSGDTEMEIGFKLSADGGETWTQATGVLETPEPMRPIWPESNDPTRDAGGFVFHRNAFEDEYGNIYTSAYGYYAADDENVYRTILVKTTDYGATWSVVSTISYHPGLNSDPAYKGLAEPCVIELADGSLYAVLRSGSVSATQSLPLYHTRSVDGGLTWSTPVAMTTASGASITGIHPSLVLMGNGLLALSTGRPNMRLYVSPDGEGTVWSEETVTFPFSRTSGNGEIVALDANRLMLVGDRGANWMNPDIYRIWAKVLTVYPAPTVDLGAEIPITQSVDVRQFPRAFATDVTASGETKRKVTVSWNENVDSPSVPSTFRNRSTLDDGTTWSSYANGAVPDLKLSNGQLWAVDRRGYMVSSSGNTEMEIGYRTSADGGETWTQATGVLETPEPMRPIWDETDDPTRDAGGFVFHGSAFEGEPGSIYMAAYGYYGSDTANRTILVKTTDYGATWSVVSTISYHPGLSSDPAYKGLGEPCVIELADGSLYAVLRSGSVSATQSLPLYHTRSVDGGLTWSTPVVMTTASGASITGIHPSLVLMGNGLLALSTGMPNMRLYVSPDGEGTVWSEETVTFPFSRTSGKGEIVALDANRLMLVGDRGSNSMNPDPFRVWAKVIEVVPG